MVTVCVKFAFLILITRRGNVSLSKFIQQFSQEFSFSSES